MIEIIVPIIPKPAPRPRFNKNGKTYMPEWYNIYKSQIAFYAKRQAPAYNLDAALFVEISFQKPCSVKSPRYGDIDNLVKGVLDALNNIIYKDDSQIVGIYARKFEGVINEIAINLTYSS